MHYRRNSNSLVLTSIIGLALATVLASGRTSEAASANITLQRAHGVEQGSGEAVIMDDTMSIRVEGLKPDSVYTVWYVNTDPQMAMAGVGQRPYMFKTNAMGAAIFKATLDEHPFGRWQRLVIVRHPNGDPQDMRHKEEALWASLPTSAWETPANPCAGY